MRLPSTTAAAPTSPAQAAAINEPATQSEIAARRRRVTRNMRSNSFDGALGLWVILRWIISGVLPRLPARILLGRDWEVSGGIRGAKLRPRRANPPCRGLRDPVGWPPNKDSVPAPRLRKDSRTLRARSTGGAPKALRPQCHRRCSWRSFARVGRPGCRYWPRWCRENPARSARSARSRPRSYRALIRVGRARRPKAGAARLPCATDLQPRDRKRAPSDGVGGAHAPRSLRPRTFPPVCPQDEPLRHPRLRARPTEPVR